MFKVSKVIFLVILLGFSLGMDSADAENQLREDHAATPFSADEIREGSPAGTFAIYRVEASGADPFRLVSEFNEVDSEKAKLSGWKESLEGELIGEKYEAESSWKDLQLHASFPAEQTTIVQKEITVPAGTWNCWVYTVKSSDGNYKEMAFARELPGPPIQMKVFAEGEEIYSMALLETGRVPEDVTEEE